MIVWRVAPIDARARRGRPFHPLYIPPSSGRHRIDNADLYTVLYASAQPAGAVAEAFASFTPWGDYLLAHPRGAVRRLVAFDVPDTPPLLDLDDARALVRRRLRPSQVVTRDPRDHAGVGAQGMGGGAVRRSAVVELSRSSMGDARLVGDRRHQGRHGRRPRRDPPRGGRGRRGATSHLDLVPRQATFAMSANGTSGMAATGCT